MFSAASARLRRIVACIDFTTAAIDGESASAKPPSVVCAMAGAVAHARKSETIRSRVTTDLHEFTENPAPSRAPPRPRCRHEPWAATRRRLLRAPITLNHAIDQKIL